MTTFLVSADHVVAKYRLVDAVVEVTYRDYRGHGGQEEFYWSKQPFGCSKSYRTAEAAIQGMLYENGCTRVLIKAI